MCGGKARRILLLPCPCGRGPPCSGSGVRRPWRLCGTCRYPLPRPGDSSSSGLHCGHPTSRSVRKHSRCALDAIRPIQPSQDAPKCSPESDFSFLELAHWKLELKEAIAVAVCRLSSSHRARCVRCLCLLLLLSAGPFFSHGLLCQFLLICLTPSHRIPLPGSRERLSKLSWMRMRGKHSKRSGCKLRRLSVNEG